MFFVVCSLSASSLTRRFPASILTNKTLQFTLADTCHVICVRHVQRPDVAACLAFLRASYCSHTSKQNTVLRATVAPQRCVVE